MDRLKSLGVTSIDHEGKLGAATLRGSELSDALTQELRLYAIAHGLDYIVAFTGEGTEAGTVYSSRDTQLQFAERRAALIDPSNLLRSEARRLSSFIADIKREKKERSGKLN